MASYFQRNKIPAKILILDPKPRISPIGGGFRLAFEDLYSDIISYVPNAGVKELDPFNRVVKTAAGDFKFDEAIFMGHHQAADLVWKLGAVGKTADGKPSNWAAVHPQFYNMKDDPNVFVIGDSVGAVSPQFGHYPKSGHVANRMGRSVAQYISQQAQGQPMKPVIIDNLCYMLVNTEPLEAISVKFDYRMGPEGHLLQTLTDNPILILLLINIILLILGTFMDMAPLIIICTPIFLPVAKAFDVDPVQFGVILLLNCGIGLITPPVGSVLFVGSAIAGIPMTRALKTIWPFWLSCLAVLMLVTFIPALSLWLPSLMK